MHLISRWDLPACFLQTLSASKGLKGVGKHQYRGLGTRHRDSFFSSSAVSPSSGTVLWSVVEERNFPCAYLMLASSWRIAALLWKNLIGNKGRDEDATACSSHCLVSWVSFSLAANRSPPEELWSPALLVVALVKGGIGLVKYTWILLYP